jgi:hypothetical protein
MPLAVFAITCPDHRKGDFSFCSSTPVGSRAIPCASNRCVGMEWKTGGASTWMTGTYDLDSNTVYWPTPS